MKRRAWVGLLVMATFLWGAAYIAFWFRRSGCIDLFDLSCNDLPIAWLERLVSFWWVRDYQTLLGGLSAVAAGWFVVSSGREQITAAKASQLELQRTRRFAALALVRSDFIHASNHVGRQIVPIQDPDMSLTRSQLQTIAEIDGSVLHIILSTLNRVEAAQRKIIEQRAPGSFQSEDDAVSASRDAAAADVLAEILREVLRALQEGSFTRLDYRMFDGADVFDYLKARNLTPADIRELSKYFYWPEPVYNYQG